MTLNAKQAQFVREYLIDLNATQAAKRAGYSDATAYSQGQRLLKDAEVAASLEIAMAKRAGRTEITADNVLRELWAIGQANPNELIAFRRGCCRYCFGKDHRHQETQGERERRHTTWVENRDAAPDPLKSTKFAVFDDLGGIGFNALSEPNPDCPECFGEGIGEAVAKDTRKLSPTALSLYAGVKVTKDGLEVKMHDKVAALTKVGQHLGMFTEKHEIAGADGGPVQHEVTVKFVGTGDTK